MNNSDHWYYICDKCGDLVTIEAAPLVDQGSWVCDHCGSSALWEFQDKDKALQHAQDIMRKRASA